MKLDQEILIQRKIDSLGRIVLPREIITAGGYNNHSFIFKADGDSVIGLFCPEVAHISNKTLWQKPRVMDKLNRLCIPKYLLEQVEIKYNTFVSMRFYSNGFKLIRN